ncbi:MAG TPA: hypothetical protein VHV08_17920 [Pirellulales bacterium]|nr:hypothetical protein [Pirellulales bacterium]
MQIQLASLQKDRVGIAAKVITTQALITQIQTDFYNSTTSANTASTYSPFSTMPYTSLVQINAYGLSLAALNKQAFEMDRKILALQARAAQLGGKGQEQTRNIVEGQVTVRQAEQHAKYAERKLRRPPPASARAAALLTRMTSFSTYASFPYDEEKQRILGWFSE